MRNVWRVKKRDGGQSDRRYRLTDVIWWTRQSDVFKEIATILGIDSADTNTPGWFPLRTKACKNILNAMSDDERQKLEEEADKMRKEGLPEDVKRQ